MTHPVNLKPGMMAIRRDGERGGPVTTDHCGVYPFQMSGDDYTSDGYYWKERNEDEKDIIAAGYPWTELGAQAGDTVRCVWDGDAVSKYEHVYGTHPEGCKDALYVITARAKPADRPRAAHKLDLRDGDVVELVAFQCDCGNEEYFINSQFVVGSERWISLCVEGRDKGHRPLFRVISRAADATPDEVVNFFAKIPEVLLCKLRAENDTHRFTLTFPHGSDTGTVVREAL